MTAKDFKQIPLDKCKPNPWNTRDEEDFNGEQFQGLVANIGKVGVLQPILVRPSKKDAYEIIFGECRWRACEGGCSWAEDDLCSACAKKEAEA